MAKSNKVNVSDNVVKITFKAQDAAFLTDMIGLCETPADLYQFGNFINNLVPFVTEFTEGFQKLSKDFEQKATAIFDRYYDKVLNEQGQPTGQKLKEGKSEDDYRNEIQGETDDFLFKSDKLKTTEKEFEFDGNDFDNFSYIFGSLNVKKAAEEDKQKEIYTAIVYSISKNIYDTLNKRNN